ncbi:5725_t:CDS:2, partial [Paraglomus brasilianum]
MEYFQKTSPEKFRFIDFYKYRQRQDDFTRSFREESGNLWRCLMSLVKDGTPQVKENARHRTKLEDVRIFWQQIENETSIDDAEAEVACKFIRRSLMWRLPMSRRR